MPVHHIVLLVGLSISISIAGARPTDLRLSLDDLQLQLGSVLAAYYPGAEIQRSEREYVASYDTQRFTVHSRDKMGRLSEQTTEVEGPNNAGFLLRLTLKPGAYQGAAVVPQTLRRPYWETWIHAIEDESGASYLSVSLDYGQNVSDEFLSRIIATIAADTDTRPSAN